MWSGFPLRRRGASLHPIEPWLVGEALMWIWLGCLPVLPSLPWGLMVQSGLVHLSLPVGKARMRVVPKGSPPNVPPLPPLIYYANAHTRARAQTHTLTHPFLLSHTMHSLHTVHGFQTHQKAVWQTYSLTQGVFLPPHPQACTLANPLHVNTLHRHAG